MGQIEATKRRASVSTDLPERTRVDQRWRELAADQDVRQTSLEGARRQERDRQRDQMRRDEERRRRPDDNASRTAKTESLASHQKAARLLRENEERDSQSRAEEDAKRKEIESLSFLGNSNPGVLPRSSTTPGVRGASSHSLQELRLNI